MKKNILTALAMIAAAAFANQVSAGHDHAVYRTWDQLACSGIASAQAYHCEIRDHFRGSRDYRRLLCGAEQLVEHMRDLSTLINRCESRRTIHHHTDTVADFVCDIRRCLLRSDFAQGGLQHRSGYGPSGSRFHGHDPCEVHLQAALQHLAEVEASLKTLCQILNGRSTATFYNGRGLNPTIISPAPTNPIGPTFRSQPQVQPRFPIQQQYPSQPQYQYEPNGVGPALAPLNNYNSSRFDDSRFDRSGGRDRFVDEHDDHDHHVQQVRRSRTTEIPIIERNNGGIYLRLGR